MVKISANNNKLPKLHHVRVAFAEIMLSEWQSPWEFAKILPESLIERINYGNLTYVTQGVVGGVGGGRNLRGELRGRKKDEKNGGEFVNCQIVINFVKRAAEVLKEEKDLRY